MTDDWKNLDPRPAMGGWAPGDYLCTCSRCKCRFTGAKLSYACADCAYKEVETKASEPVIDEWWTARTTEEAAARIIRDYEAGKPIHAKEGWVVRLASALLKK